MTMEILKFWWFCIDLLIICAWNSTDESNHTGTYSIYWPEHNQEFLFVNLNPFMAYHIVCVVKEIIEYGRWPLGIQCRTDANNILRQNYSVAEYGKCAMSGTQNLIWTLQCVYAKPSSQVKAYVR